MTVPAFSFSADAIDNGVHRTFSELKHDGFYEAAAAYETIHSVDIKAVNAVIDELIRISDTEGRSDKIEKISRLSNLSNAGSPDDSSTSVSPAVFFDYLKNISAPGGFKIRIIDNRAAAYPYKSVSVFDSYYARAFLKSAPGGSGAAGNKYLPAFYFKKTGVRWVLDINYIFKLINSATGILYQDAETFILAEQIWFLSQYEKFAELERFASGNYICGLNDARAGNEVQKIAEEKLSGAALHFYMSLVDFKAGRYKHSYSHISACRILAAEYFIVETVFNMLLTQRKFGRLVKEEFVIACRSDPYNYLALMIIGEFYNLNFRYSLSYEAFELASFINPYLTPHYHIVYADTLEKLKNYNAAGDQLSKCGAYGSDFYYTRYLAGKKYITGGDEKKAAREFESVIGFLNYAETRREVARWLMNFHYKNGNFEAYYAYRRTFLASFFNSPLFIGILGVLWLLYILKKYIARYIMIPLMNLIAAIFKSEILYDRTFDAYCNFSDSDAAVKYFYKYFISIDKQTSPGAYERCSLKLANYLLSIYRPDEAKKIFTALLSFRPSSLEALLGLAIAEYDLKNYEIALEYFKSGIDSATDNHLFYYYAGICTMIEGRRKEAAELIMISYKINSSFEPALSLCNNYYLSNNSIGELVSFYDDIFILGDFSENFIQYYLKLNISRMDRVRVLKMLDRLQNFKISKAGTYLEIARACRELDKFEEAVIFIHKGILTAIGYKWTMKFCGTAFIKWLTAFMTFYTNDAMIKTLLLELGITYKKMGCAKKAEAVLKKIIKNFPDNAYAHFLLDNFNRCVELMTAELNESDYPWNNASIVEAICYCLKETNDGQRLGRYREWGIHYASSISNEFGIFSYRYLRYIPKTLFLSIINGTDGGVKINF